MKILIQVQRYNPETGEKPYFQKYPVEAQPTDRVLSVLMDIKRTMDPTLGLRKSCAHGVCGSDAMVINGKERLACKTLVKDVAEKDGDIVRCEPLRTLPVERDLMVDQTRFFENYMSVKPYFIGKDKTESRPGQGAASPQAEPKEPAPLEKERLQSPEDRARIEEATRCILCGACYSACPIIQESNPEFLGPAAIVQSARFLEDSRDQGFAEHAEAIDYPNGIWPCKSHFECTRVCPRSIKITKLINRTKRKIKA